MCFIAPDRRGIANPCQRFNPSGIGGPNLIVSWADVSGDDRECSLRGHGIRASFMLAAETENDYVLVFGSNALKEVRG